MAQSEAGGDPRRDGGRGSSRGEDAVDARSVGEPLERRLVVQRQNRPAVREPEARGVRVAVDGDDVEPARTGGREQARLARAENEQPQRNRLCDNRDVSTVLAERVAELRA